MTPILRWLMFALVTTFAAGCFVVYFLPVVIPVAVLVGAGILALTVYEAIFGREE